MQGEVDSRFRGKNRGGRAGLKSPFQKSDISENWTFWIPAPVSRHEDRLFAGMTDLGIIFHVLPQGVVENRLNMLGVYHRRGLMKRDLRPAPTRVSSGREGVGGELGDDNGLGAGKLGPTHSHPTIGPCFRRGDERGGRGDERGGVGYQRGWVSL